MEFMYREYEWKWLLIHFNNPDFEVCNIIFVFTSILFVIIIYLIFFNICLSNKAISKINAANRGRNTCNHHAGSRPFASLMDEATQQGGVNPYVYTYEHAYPQSTEDSVSLIPFAFIHQLSLLLFYCYLPVN